MDATAEHPAIRVPASPPDPSPPPPPPPPPPSSSAPPTPDAPAAPADESAAKAAKRRSRGAGRRPPTSDALPDISDILGVSTPATGNDKTSDNDTNTDTDQAGANDDSTVTNDSEPTAKVGQPRPGTPPAPPADKASPSTLEMLPNFEPGTGGTGGTDQPARRFPPRIPPSAADPTAEIASPAPPAPTGDFVAPPGSGNAGGTGTPSSPVGEDTQQVGADEHSLSADPAPTGQMPSIAVATAKAASLTDTAQVPTVTPTPTAPEPPSPAAPSIGADVEAPPTMPGAPPSAPGAPPTLPGAPPTLPDAPPTLPGAPPTLPGAAPRPKQRQWPVRVLAGIAAVLVLIVAGWAIDSILSEGEVIRGTVLGDTPIGGLDAAGLDEVLAQLDSELAMTSLQVTAGDETVNTDPGNLGALLDRDLLREQAMEARRDSFVLLRPFDWLTTFFTEEQIDLAYTVDQATAAEAIDTTLSSLVTPPQEPGLRITGDLVNIAPGQDGQILSVEELVADLPTALEADTPHVLELTAYPASPRTSDADVQVVADEIAEATAGGAQIRVLDDTVELEPAEIRAWIQLDTSGDTPTWTIDQEQALAELRTLFPRLGAEDQLARFEVVDGEPVIVPASETVICCAADSIAAIREDLLAPAPPPAEGEGEDEGETSGEGETDEGEAGPAPKLVVLEPEIVGADEGVAELEALGIVEEISSFTTEHACCQPRVTNIHRFADIVRGAIILPGEDFSLNGHVGRRTIENGFVADGAIANGVLEPQVGGGVSQFATTFFNASFYAGLDFNEYQSHSLYISRYPRGREATISWPKPDLSVKNTTDYGILIWTEYTDTSITVSMYSTKHIEVEDLPLLQSSNGECSIFTTPRVRTYPDGEVVEDSVFAQYRPGEGLNCRGESTVPPEGPTAVGDDATPPAEDADAQPPGSDTPLIPTPPDDEPGTDSDSDTGAAAPLPGDGEDGEDDGAGGVDGGGVVE